MTPDELTQSIRAFQESRVLLTALELDVFTAAAPGAAAPAVAARCGTEPRATERLLNAIVALGLMHKREGVFENAPLAARFLVAGAPDDARPALRHHVSLWRTWSTLTDAVRVGHAVAHEEMSVRRQDEWTEPFIAAMHRNASERAPRLVSAIEAGTVSHLLDIGGGSGAYSIAFALANPRLKAEIIDLDTVVPIAERHIREAGLTDRVTTRTGDLRRDELGSGFDVALLSSICHMLGAHENQDLLARVLRALASGGRVVISDFILEPDGTAPRHAALFALNMLVGTPTGSTYTEAEYADWLSGAGFTDVRRVRLDGPADLMVGQKPAAV
jgi:predicted O-methyltransferase YrrM